MNKEDYFKYYIQGSDHYLIPKYEFIELFNEMSNWREEVKELNQKYLNAVADYETTMAEKEQLNSLVNSCQEEIRRLKKQLEDYKDKINWYENFEINKTIDKLRIKHKNQQKEFIEWLENGINQVRNTEFLDERIQRAGLVAYNRVLSKYKEIIGGKDDNK